MKPRTEHRSPAHLARLTYNTAVATIRATIDPSTRAYAAAMSAASRTYEEAMVADLGIDAASKLGAGMVSL